MVSWHQFRVPAVVPMWSGPNGKPWLMFFRREKRTACLPSLARVIPHIVRHQSCDVCCGAPPATRIRLRLSRCHHTQRETFPSGETKMRFKVIGLYCNYRRHRSRPDPPARSCKYMRNPCPCVRSIIKTLPVRHPSHRLYVLDCAHFQNLLISTHPDWHHRRLAIPTVIPSAAKTRVLSGDSTGSSQVSQLHPAGEPSVLLRTNASARDFAACPQSIKKDTIFPSSVMSRNCA